MATGSSARTTNPPSWPGPAVTVPPTADTRSLMPASPDVRVVAREYLVYAALASVIGTFAFTYDGIYIGATWTRDMRNLMILCFALYLGVWWLLHPLGNSGLWLAILIFFGARGALQAMRYPALARATFRPATARP